MATPAWLAVGATLAALIGPVVGPVAATAAGSAIGLAGLGIRGGRWRAVARAFIALSVGVVALGCRLALVPPPEPATLTLPDGSGPWSAVVATLGSTREGARPATLRLEDPPILLAGSLPWFPPVMPGDRVVVEGAVAPPPDGDYGAYLRRIGAAGTIRVRSLVLAPTADPGWGRALEGLRRSAAGALAAAIPEPEAGLAAGIVVGLRDRVDRSLAADFTAVGASHVVAISGWNIAIVAATIGAITGSLARRRRVIVMAIAIGTYVVFVGASPSVVRAAAMAAVALLARESGRPGRAIAALGLAVTILLLLDPSFVDDVGFRLSTLATAGLVAWGTPIAGRLSGPRPSRARAWVAESLGVSLAAQAATLPIVVGEFGRLSPISPAVNLAIAPLVAPAMAAAVVALVGGVAGAAGLPAVAAIAGLPAWLLLGAIVGVVRIGAGVPFASVELAPPVDGIAAIGTGAILLLVAGRGPIRAAVRATFGGAGSARTTAAGTTRRSGGTRSARRPGDRITAVVLAAAVAAVGVAIAHRPDGIARVTILDVGQGDAILVEGGRGGRLLVDGGPDPDRLVVALEERLPPWDRRIDLLVLTHPHEDHVAGLAHLVERYDVHRVAEAGMSGPGPGYAAWVAQLERDGITSGRLAAGDVLRVDDIRLRVLWPDPGSVPDRPADDGTAINNVSIVLLGEVGGRRFLLTGDIEDGVDPILLARGLPRVDLLKVAHHGSATASTEALLGALAPRVAVASAGADNRYGHPAPSTLDRLEATGARVLRTDRDGTVEVTFEEGGLSIETSGGRRAALASLVTATATATAPPAGFLCAIPALAAPSAGRPSAAPPAAILPRPGVAADLRYHRPDGNDPNRDSADRPVRRLLGRRRLVDRPRPRDVPDRPRAVSTRRPGPLARPCGPLGRRAPPRGHLGPPRDRRDVRRRDARDHRQPRAARPVEG